MIVSPTNYVLILICLITVFPLSVLMLRKSDLIIKFISLIFLAIGLLFFSLLAFIPYSELLLTHTTPDQIAAYLKHNQSIGTSAVFTCLLLVLGLRGFINKSFNALNKNDFLYKIIISMGTIFLAVYFLHILFMFYFIVYTKFQNALAAAKLGVDVIIFIGLADRLRAYRLSINNKLMC